MTPIMFIYKSIRKGWHIFAYNPFCYAATLLMMYGNSVRFRRFRTSGIPIIYVDRKGGRITIGDNLRMNNGNAGNNIGFSSRCSFMAMNGAHIQIHDNVGMSQTALCAIGANIIIGCHTILGGGVKIYSSDFHSKDYTDRRDHKFADKENLKSAPVVIGEDCFIGAGTIILKGVTIGDRTIIGAGSVVTKSIPSDCIAAGNPCKVLK